MPEAYASIWQGWNQATQWITTSATWPLWNQQYTATSGTLTIEPWSTWLQTNAATSNITYLQTPWVQTPPTPEEIAAAEVRRAEAQRQREVAARAAQVARLAREKDQKAAARRALSLLKRNLTQEQRREYDEYGHFRLLLPNGKQYRIAKGTHGNVVLLDEGGQPTRAFCIQPYDVPDEDAMLAQKMMLEADEASFLRIANSRPIRPGETRPLYGWRAVPEERIA